MGNNNNGQVNTQIVTYNFHQNYPGSIWDTTPTRKKGLGGGLPHKNNRAAHRVYKNNRHLFDIGVSHAATAGSVSSTEDPIINRFENGGPLYTQIKPIHPGI